MKKNNLLKNNCFSRFNNITLMKTLSNNKQIKKNKNISMKNDSLMAIKKIN